MKTLAIVPILCHNISGSWETFLKNLRWKHQVKLTKIRCNIRVFFHTCGSSSWFSTHSPHTSVRNKLCRIAKCDALLNICDSVLHACSIKMRRQKNLFFLLFHTSYTIKSYQGQTFKESGFIFQKSPPKNTIKSHFNFPLGLFFSSDSEGISPNSINNYVMFV